MHCADTATRSKLCFHSILVALHMNMFADDSEAKNAMRRDGGDDSDDEGDNDYAGPYEFAPRPAVMQENEDSDRRVLQYMLMHHTYDLYPPARYKLSSAWCAAGQSIRASDDEAGLAGTGPMSLLCGHAGLANFRPGRLVVRPVSAPLPIGEMMALVEGANIPESSKIPSRNPAHFAAG
jgi:hypothetical protein